MGRNNIVKVMIPIAKDWSSIPAKRDSPAVKAVPTVHQTVPDGAGRCHGSDQAVSCIHQKKEKESGEHLHIRYCISFSERERKHPLKSIKKSLRVFEGRRWAEIGYMINIWLYLLDTEGKLDCPLKKVSPFEYYFQ